jgi:hypothetical protein
MPFKTTFSLAFGVVSQDKIHCIHIETLVNLKVFFSPVNQVVYSQFATVECDVHALFLFPEDGQVLNLVLPGNQILEILVKQPNKKSTETGENDENSQDYKLNYARLVVELGLLYQNLIDMIKLPDRDRAIRLLKLTMVMLKQHNNQSKYAYEIMRLLVHQLCCLSEREAHEEFYGMFVNTAGKVDGHVAVDDRMEWCVNTVKKNIKHMASNATEKNIKRRTAAISGISDISENFDKNTKVVVRAKKHKEASSLSDEIQMLEDLRQMRPFHFEAGRHHNSFPNVNDSLLKNVDASKIRSWVHQKIYLFSTEYGQ